VRAVRPCRCARATRVVHRLATVAAGARLPASCLVSTTSPLWLQCLAVHAVPLLSPCSCCCWPEAVPGGHRVPTNQGVERRQSSPVACVQAARKQSKHICQSVQSQHRRPSHASWPTPDVPALLWPSSSRHQQLVHVQVKRRMRADGGMAGLFRLPTGDNVSVCPPACLPACLPACRPAVPVCVCACSC
jgi:hypothetical protein